MTQPRERWRLIRSISVGEMLADLVMYGQYKMAVPDRDCWAIQYELRVYIYQRITTSEPSNER